MRRAIQGWWNGCPSIWRFAVGSTFLLLWIDTVLLIRRPMLAGSSEDWVLPFFYGQVSWIAAWSLRLPRRTVLSSVGVSGFLFALLVLINRWQLYFDYRPAIFATSWRVLIQFAGYWLVWHILRRLADGPATGTSDHAEAARRPFQIALADLMIAPMFLSVIFAYAQSYGLSPEKMVANMSGEFSLLIRDHAATSRAVSAALLGATIDRLLTGGGRKRVSKSRPALLPEAEPVAEPLVGRARSGGSLFSVAVLVALLLGLMCLGVPWLLRSSPTSQMSALMGDAVLGPLVELASLGVLLLAAKTFVGSADPFAMRSATEKTSGVGGE